MEFFFEISGYLSEKTIQWFKLYPSLSSIKIWKKSNFRPLPRNLEFDWFLPTVLLKTWYRLSVRWGRSKSGRATSAVWQRKRKGLLFSPVSRSSLVPLAARPRFPAIFPTDREPGTGYAKFYHPFTLWSRIRLGERHNSGGRDNFS